MIKRPAFRLSHIADFEWRVFLTCTAIGVATILFMSLAVGSTITPAATAVLALTTGFVPCVAASLSSKRRTLPPFGRWAGGLLAVDGVLLVLQSDRLDNWAATHKFVAGALENGIGTLLAGGVIALSTYWLVMAARMNGDRSAPLRAIQRIQQGLWVRWYARWYRENDVLADPKTNKDLLDYYPKGIAVNSGLLCSTYGFPVHVLPLKAQRCPCGHCPTDSNAAFGLHFKADPQPGWLTDRRSTTWSGFSRTPRQRAYRIMLSRLGHPVEDDLPTLCATKITGTDPITVQFAVARYSDFIDTCATLEHEWITYNQAPRRLRCLRHPFGPRLRKGITTASPFEVAASETRACGLALSVLIAIRWEDAVFVVVKRRSNEVAIKRNQFHIVPAGMLQFEQAGPDKDALDPHAVIRRGDHCLMDQFWREYLEELFQIRPPENALGLAWYHQHPQVSELEAWLKSGMAQLELTGIAVDLLQLRADVCGLLFIDGDAIDGFASSRLMAAGLNQEYASQSELRESGRSQLRLRSVTVVASGRGGQRLKVLTDAELKEAYPEIARPEEWVPAGFGAFMLGLMRLRQEQKRWLARPV